MARFDEKDTEAITEFVRACRRGDATRQEERRMVTYRGTGGVVIMQTNAPIIEQTFDAILAGFEGGT